MNTVNIHYFAHENGMHFAAVAPGRYSESVCFYDASSYGAARIDLSHHASSNCRYYETIENGYSPCSRDTYVEARLNALAALIPFFGDAEEFTTPSTRPLYVERAGRQIENDLPF